MVKINVTAMVTALARVVAGSVIVDVRLVGGTWDSESSGEFGVHARAVARRETGLNRDKGSMEHMVHCAVAGDVAARVARNEFGGEIRGAGAAGQSLGWEDAGQRFHIQVTAAKNKERGAAGGSYREKNDGMERIQ